jgi:hypothetical protein
MCFGTDSSLRISSLSTTRHPSKGTLDGRRGLDPVAITKTLALTEYDEPSCGVTLIECVSSNDAKPLIISILFFSV